MTPSHETAARHARHSALLVDDDAFMLALVADMLRDLGTREITVAKDGDAALRAFDAMKHPPGYIVCDLHMPGSDGFQFMEKLADRDFAGGVIVVSGMDPRTLKSAELMAKFHRLHIVASLAKPVDPASLAAAFGRLH